MDDKRRVAVDEMLDGLISETRETNPSGRRDLEDKAARVIAHGATAEARRRDHHAGYRFPGHRIADFAAHGQSEQQCEKVRHDTRRLAEVRLTTVSATAPRLEKDNLARGLSANEK